MTCYTDFNLNFEIEPSNVRKISVEDVISGKIDPPTIDDDTQIFVFAGLTGSGKSRLINFLCKQNDLVESSYSINSITRGVTLILLEIRSLSKQFKMKPRKVALIDTQGLFDTNPKYPDEKVLNTIREGIDRINIKKIDKFVIVQAAEKIHHHQRAALEKLIDAFDLGNQGHAGNNILVIPKCDGLNSKRIDGIKDEYKKDETFSKIIKKTKINIDEREFCDCSNMMFIGIPDPTTLVEGEFKKNIEENEGTTRQKIWTMIQSNVTPIRIENKLVQLIKEYCSIL